MSSASGSRQHAVTGARKPKRAFRYLEGYLSEQERREQEQLMLAATQSSNDESTSAAETSSSNGKRIKTAKACLFCKRSHMSCEVERPCSRCISRGIGERCCDTEEELAELVGTADGQAKGTNGQSATMLDTITPQEAAGIGDHSFDDILTFLGNMQAATEEWGPVPSASMVSSSTFAQPSWAAAMTPSNELSVQDEQSAALHFLADNAISPRPGMSPRTPAVRQASEGAARQFIGNERGKSIEHVNKPFVSGSLPFYSEERATTQAPWSKLLQPDWTSSDCLEDSLTRPYQYAYGYTRIERWVQSPLSGWTAESASKVKAVLDHTRPLLRRRWADLSDLQLVQHEERHEAVVRHYRQYVCEAVPLPLIVVRRTFEIVCANRAFARLCDTQQSVFDSGRLCLYQLLEQSFVVDIVESMVELIESGKQAQRSPINLQGRVRFTCSSSASSTSMLSNVVLRHVDQAVSLSLEAVVDEHGLPLCFVCALTPMVENLSR